MAIPAETAAEAAEVPGHAQRVSARLLANDMAALMEWTHLRESSVNEHIDQIFAMAALEDTAGGFWPNISSHMWRVVVH